jgi:hypothetical protein
MAFAETANLAVTLTLGGNFNSQLAKTRAGLRGFDKDASRAYKAGTQIGTGIKRGTVLAIAGIGALTALMAQSVKEGQEAANVQLVFANSIKKSGKVSEDYVTILNDQQKALMELAGVDDELIKKEQTRLIQMGLTGKQVAKATPLILDFAKATGIDLLTATKLFGKAAQGNTGALSRYGVQIDKAKAKVDPFGAAIDALNGKFGGTTKALSGQLDTRLAAFKEGLANIREEAGMKLLPVLTRIVDVAGKQLVPAFAKFIDRILPDIEAGLNSFADLLDNGGAAKGIEAITDALGPMVALVKASAAPVKAIVGAFNALPKEVQTVLVGAFAVNKLTGGLVTNAIGAAIGGVLKTMTVQAGVVNVNGGVTGGGGGLPGGAGAAGGLVAALGTATLALAAGAAAYYAVATSGAGSPGADPTSVNNAVKSGTMTFNGRVFVTNPKAISAGIESAVNAGNIAARGNGKHFNAIATALAGIKARAMAAGKNPTDKQVQATLERNQARAAAAAAIASRKAAEIKAEQIRTTAEARDTDNSVRRGTTAVSGTVRTGTGQVVGAIRANRPIITTIVNVNATTVQKSVTVVERYGTTGGSRNNDDHGK